MAPELHHRYRRPKPLNVLRPPATEQRSPNEHTEHRSAGSGEGPFPGANLSRECPTKVTSFGWALCPVSGRKMDPGRTGLGQFFWLSHRKVVPIPAIRSEARSDWHRVEAVLQMPWYPNSGASLWSRYLAASRPTNSRAVPRENGRGQRVRMRVWLQRRLRQGWRFRPDVQCGAPASTACRRR